MNQLSKITKQSVTVPGVSFTIKSISEARFLALRRLKAEAVARLLSITKDLEPLAEKEKEDKAAGKEPVQSAEVQAIVSRAQEVAAEINIITLKWGVLSLDGYTVDDKPGTIDDLIENGPLRLSFEIFETIEKMIKLDGDEEKNSNSLTISGEVEARPESPISVTTAESSSSIESETAASSPS